MEGGGPRGSCRPRRLEGRRSAWGVERRGCSGSVHRLKRNSEDSHSRYTKQTTFHTIDNTLSGDICHLSTLSIHTHLTEASAQRHPTSLDRPASVPRYERGDPSTLEAARLRLVSVTTSPPPTCAESLWQMASNRGRLPGVKREKE